MTERCVVTRTVIMPELIDVDVAIKLIADIAKIPHTQFHMFQTIKSRWLGG